jgi:hypothetical protein
MLAQVDSSVTLLNNVLTQVMLLGGLPCIYGRPPAQDKRVLVSFLDLVHYCGKDMVCICQCLRSS